MSVYVAAIDLGASSGRVMLASYNAKKEAINLKEIHRFKNQMMEKEGYHCWDIESIYLNIIYGLNKIDQDGIKLSSIGIDSWAVDYVCLDEYGNILGLPVAYRDDRTNNIPELVFKRISKNDLYRKTGIQFQKFNTIFQLKSLVCENPDWLKKIKKIQMIPDYLHYKLTGNMSCEYTNASTTQLLNAENRTWDDEILELADIPKEWLMTVCEPGTTIGHWTSPSGHSVPVIAPATHDTASAIVATPFYDAKSAYISSGTWSLVGIESHKPYLGPIAQNVNLTNEGGAEKTYRVLKNVMGLWLLQGIQKEFSNLSFVDLTSLATDAEPFKYIINPNDDCFINPNSMTEAISDYCYMTGQGTPTLPSEFARCIFDSLALLYRKSILEIEAVIGFQISAINIVGGGSNNELLNKLCANICNRKVLAGPSEASALGNVAIQLIGLKELNNISEFRTLLNKNLNANIIEPEPIDGFNAVWAKFSNLCTSSFVRFCERHKETV